MDSLGKPDETFANSRGGEQVAKMEGIAAVSTKLSIRNCCEWNRNVAGAVVTNKK